MKSRAFTLIELLVVVLIIGILAAIALPQYQKAVMRSRIVGVLPNMRYLADQIEIYRLENGAYPPDALGDVMDVDIPGCSGNGRYACQNYGLDYEYFDPADASQPFIRLCYPDCSDGLDSQTVLYFYLRTGAKDCRSSISGFCDSLKNVWKD